MHFFFIAVFIGQELNSIKHLLDEAVKLWIALAML